MSRKFIFAYFVVAASIACVAAWHFTYLAATTLFTQIFSAAMVLHVHWFTNRRTKP